MLNWGEKPGKLDQAASKPPYRRAPDCYTAKSIHTVGELRFHQAAAQNCHQLMFLTEAVR
jgi:hypothetical protein